MLQRHYFKNKIFNSASNKDFVKLALELFYYQSENNEVYRTYINNLLPETRLESIKRRELKTLEEIPFLPIQFFKQFEVKTGAFDEQIVFTSSGTTGSNASKHMVRSLELYEESFQTAFSTFYPESSEYCVLALLPSYLEREGSSLIYMMEKLISNSHDEDSGFYLNDLEALSGVLKKKKEQGAKTILLGVTYALLDLAESFPLEFEELIIMETGGMKGRRKEMIREEVHSQLKKAFGVKDVHSEYGMTELLSQAYSHGRGMFTTPSWMKVLIREVTDPLSFSRNGKTGGINFIDLANIDSCAFIETQDLGRVHTNGSFEVMGRFDNSDIRGCNLMVI